MDAETRAVVREATRASCEERMAFPEAVAMLSRAGVQRYHADLVAGTRTYFLPDGGFEVVPTAHTYQPDARFSAEGVTQAVRAAQAGEIRYLAFCARVAAHGCAGYLVSLAGERVLYYGVTGASCVEWFPGRPRRP